MQNEKHFMDISENKTAANEGFKKWYETKKKMLVSFTAYPNIFLIDYFSHK